MELFEKIYSCYYHVVKEILTEACEHPLTRKQIEETAKTYGYQESALTIVPKLLDGEWLLLRRSADLGMPRYESLLSHKPQLPLTNLQKAWLKALLSDPRIRLFFKDSDISRLKNELSYIEPLYRDEDFHYFDRYADGDNYASPTYRENFQIILDALTQKRPLLVAYQGRTKDTATQEAAPYQLQYSSKDDKFRLCCLRLHKGSFSLNTILNLNRIVTCCISRRELSKSELVRLDAHRFHPVKQCADPVVLEISGERNSLERCMLHFAHYEKHTVYDEEKDVYLCSIYYDRADETELLIEILSFGPVVRVLGPKPFLDQVRARVRRQHELFFDRTD